MFLIAGVLSEHDVGSRLSIICAAIFLSLNGELGREADVQQQSCQKPSQLSAS